jgi:hypothetical protein
MSTLHTDNAPSVVTRLMDIGAEPYVIASALVGVVAQRWCAACVQAAVPPPLEVLRSLMSGCGRGGDSVLKSVGCDQSTTSYRGRIGIYEVMRVTDDAAAHLGEISEDQLREAVSGGMITLEGRISKVKSGCDAEELLRVVTEVRDADVVRSAAPRWASTVPARSAASASAAAAALRPRHGRMEFLSLLRRHQRSPGVSRNGSATGTQAAGASCRLAISRSSSRWVPNYELLEIAPPRPTVKKAAACRSRATTRTGPAHRQNFRTWRPTGPQAPQAYRILSDRGAGRSRPVRRGRRPVSTSAALPKRRPSRRPRRLRRLREAKRLRQVASSRRSAPLATSSSSRRR